MRRLAPLVLLCACSHPSAPPTPSTIGAEAGVAAAPPPAAATPAALRKVDEGTLKLVLAGREIGSESFTTSERAGGGRTLASRSSLRLGDKPVQADGSLDVDAGWRPEAASFKRQAGAQESSVALARREGGKLVQKTTSAKSEDEVEEKTRSDLYLGDVQFSHLAALCTLAGAEPRELALFPAATVKIGAMRPLGSGGRDLKLVPALIDDRNPVEVICDGARLVLARYPGLGMVAVREGFEDLAGGPAKPAGQKPTIPPGLTEVPRVVAVRAGRGALLSCSLLLPADRSAIFPAVVFVSGSGPEDRDDDSLDPDAVQVALFKHLAIALAQGGVASLRCDDRGVGKSTGKRDGMTLDLLVADAGAMLGQLRSEAGVDGARVALVGHAEGGNVAALVAAQDRSVKAVALLAAPGRSLDERLLDVRDEANRREGFKEEYVAKERKRLLAVYAAVRAGKPLPASATEEERRSIEPALAFLQGHFRSDPVKNVQKLKVPVFLAQGGKDEEVSVQVDTERLRAVLAKAGGPPLTVKVYPELDHAFATHGPSTPVPAKPRSGPAEAHLDLDFIGDLVTFLKAAL